MIYVITHKIFDNTFLNSHYKVLHVGTGYSPTDYLRDDTGDNIAKKNGNYCELTGLYWIWKNTQQSNNDITGLLHYRRFFTTKFNDLKYTYFNIMPEIIDYTRLEKALKKNDIILPIPIKICRTVYRFYSDLHMSEDLDITKEVIKEVSPDYLIDFNKVMNMHKFYYGNMMICKANILASYSEWLFNILFEVEKRIDFNKYKDEYQKRVLGFIAERLLYVWVYHNNLKIKEYPVYNTEKRRKSFFSLNKKRFKNLLRHLTLTGG